MLIVVDFVELETRGQGEPEELGYQPAESVVKGLVKGRDVFREFAFIFGVYSFSMFLGR